MKYVSRSKFYKQDFIDKVKQQILSSRETFLLNCRHAQSQMSVSFKVKISEREHIYALRRIFEDIFCSNVTNYIPSVDEVLNQVNFKASSGLPNP